MLVYFLIVFGLVILAELIKGLSANGTPPVLQNLPGRWIWRVLCGPKSVLSALSAARYWLCWPYCCLPKNG